MLNFHRSSKYVAKYWACDSSKKDGLQNTDENYAKIFIYVRSILSRNLGDGRGTLQFLRIAGKPTVSYRSCNYHGVPPKLLQPFFIDNADFPCRDLAIPSPHRFHGVKICSIQEIEDILSSVNKLMGSCRRLAYFLPSRPTASDLFFLLKNKIHSI